MNILSNAVILFFNHLWNETLTNSVLQIANSVSRHIAASIYEAFPS